MDFLGVIVLIHPLKLQPRAPFCPIEPAFLRCGQIQTTRAEKRVCFIQKGKPEIRPVERHNKSLLVVCARGCGVVGRRG